VGQHVFIEGDNLEVLKLLYRSYFGRVKMIYIDPPYNTGNEFIYPDDFSDPLDNYLRLTGQKNGNGDYQTNKIEKNGRIHSNWLSMMYPRLSIARQLLRDDGVIFVSIDDHEVHNLRSLMNEVFGEENFVATIIWQKVYAKNTAKHFSEDHDYIVVYARNAAEWRPELLPRTEAANARYDNPDKDERGPWKPGDLTARNYYSEGLYEVTSPSGKTFKPSLGTYWRVKHKKFLQLDADRRVWWGPDGDNMPQIKRFLSEVKQGMVPQTLWEYEDVGHTQDAKKELLRYVPYENTDNVLDSVKPPRLIQEMLTLGTNAENGDIVLDFFAGSSTTGHAVLKQNREDGARRRYIGVQFPEPEDPGGCEQSAPAGSNRQKGRRSTGGVGPQGRLARRLPRFQARRVEPEALVRHSLEGFRNLCAGDAKILRPAGFRLGIGSHDLGGCSTGGLQPHIPPGKTSAPAWANLLACYRFR
jgi:adenine-specific DNA-methyltransferase